MYNMSKRHNGELLECHVPSYMDCIHMLNDKYNHCGYDIIIHPSNQSMRDYMQEQTQIPYDNTQAGWAFL